MNCNCSQELPKVEGPFKEVMDNILDNSFIKQPSLAFGATLTLFSTLASRKFVFSGTCSNLYVLNIGPSGSGKNAPQEKVKEIFIDLRADSLLGAGDYVSDAALMDHLGVNPVRLDIMDEAGGILRSINSGKAEYNGKMADILAELYTTSNSKYLGRQTAEGNKGSCYRPNVNILASTTPAGFQEGVTRQAIEKGLLGRFLIFQADAKNPAARVRGRVPLPLDTKNKLQYILDIKPHSSQEELGGITQTYIDVPATEDAHKLLDEVFDFFDQMRRDTEENSILLPIIARLFQQMTKLVLIYSVSQVPQGALPLVDVNHVEFGYRTIMYFFEQMKEVCSLYIHEGYYDHSLSKILGIIQKHGGVMTKSELSRETRNLKRKQRDDILVDLQNVGDILIEQEQYDGLVQTVIRSQV